jgi:hypothetical protein
MNKYSKEKGMARKKTNDEKIDAIENAGLAGVAAEVVQRYGSANKEHLVAYKGVDNETGKSLSKGLKSISESKVHADYRRRNFLHQICLTL